MPRVSAARNQAPSRAGSRDDVGQPVAIDIAVPAPSVGVGEEKGQDHVHGRTWFGVKARASQSVGSRARRSCLIGSGQSAPFVAEHPSPVPGAWRWSLAKRELANQCDVDFCSRLLRRDRMT
jgi:hypothetical protein